MRRNGAYRRDWLPVLAACSALAVGFVPGAVADGYDATPFCAGESLRYEAHWGFIPLGSVVVSQQTADAAARRFIISMAGGTAPGIPIKEVSFRNHSILSPQFPSNREFVFENLTSGSRTTCRPDPVDPGLVVEVVRDGTAQERKVAHAGPVYDAPGFLMLARCVARSNHDLAAAVIVGRTILNVRLGATEERKRFDVDGIARPLRARRFDGKAEEGDHGRASVKATFQVWLTEDGAAIPLRLSFATGLGSIVFEIKGLDRPGFVPPALADRSTAP